MKFAARILLLAGLAGAAFGQGIPLPIGKPQFFSSNGVPLAGGHVCSFNSGTTTAVATFSDFSLTTLNSVCVTLDSGGRGNIWLDPSLVYRIVLKDAANVTIWTADGVSGAVGGSLSGATWTLNGSSISNAVGSKVCIGPTTCAALAQLNVTGTSSGTSYLIRIDDAGNSPGINLYGGGNSFGSIGADSAGVRLRDGSNNSQLLVSPGNVTVQNAGTGSTTLTLKGGGSQGSTRLLNILSNGGSDLAYVDASGRILGTLFNAVTASGADIAYQTHNSNFSVNGNGDITSNGSINATGAGGSDPYKVNGTTIVDASGNATFTTLTCTGTPCGSGGGGGGGGAPGGITLSLQTKASASTFGGSADLTYNSTTGIVQLLGSGYLTSHGGFVTDNAAVNSIQSPNGGVTGKWIYASDSWFLAEEAAPALSGSGQSRFYMDSTAHKVQVSQNGGAYAGVATRGAVLTNGNCVSIDGAGNFVDAGGPCTTGGGGGTVSSSTSKNITYYTGTGTTVGGSGNLTWDNATQQAAITTTSTAVAGLTVTNGYISSAGGLSTASTAVNSIQSPAGGVTGKWLYSGESLFIAEGAAPALSASGQAKLYADSATHTLLLSQNGSAFAAIGAGGGGVSSITGTANQVIRNVSTGAVILSLPQDIATTSNVNFATVTTAGVLQSSASGGALSFKNSNNLFSVDGNGNISAAGQLNLAGGGGANLFKINGATVIDSNRNATVQNLTVSGTCTGCGGGGGTFTTILPIFNQTTVVNSPAGTYTIGTAQAIGTSSTPTFSGVISNGAFNSTASGGSIAFQTSNTATQIDGSGNISATGQINLNGGGSSYKMGGQVVINSSRQFVGSGVDVGSNGISAGGYNLSGGLIGQNWNLTFPSPFTINGGGSFTSLIIRGGIVVSAF